MSNTSGLSEQRAIQVVCQYNEQYKWYVSTMSKTSGLSLQQSNTSGMSLQCAIEVVCLYNEQYKWSVRTKSNTSGMSVQ